MQFKNMNLCDFCFEPVNPDSVCTKCGLTHETYHQEDGMLMPGTIILGKYIIGRVMGHSEFANTYLAYSGERGSVVALKEYYPCDVVNRAKGEEKISLVSDDKIDAFNKGVDRFLEEAKVLSQFSANKNIVNVYEFFYANNTAYYSVEYMDVINLNDYIINKGGKLSEAEAVETMKTVCEALITVHNMQLLHRAISPDNILVCKDGEMKLSIDFGSIMQVNSNSRSNTCVITNQMFAPIEQYQQSGVLGAWTDIYALGASMYYAVTGNKPLDAVSRIEKPDLEFDSSLGLSSEFADIIRKCMQNKAEDRYQSIIELVVVLNQLGSDYSSADNTEHELNNTEEFSSEVKGSDSSCDRDSTPIVASQLEDQNDDVISNKTYIPTENAENYQQPEYSIEDYQKVKSKRNIILGIIIGVYVLVVIAIIVSVIIGLTAAPEIQELPHVFGVQPMS